MHKLKRRSPTTVHIPRPSVSVFSDWVTSHRPPPDGRDHVRGPQGVWTRGRVDNVKSCV